MPRPLRYLASFLFLAVWAACGYAFHLDPNSYLLLGIPLTAFFQVVVKREPLRALWLREAPPLELSPMVGVIFLGLAIVPAISLAQAIQKHASAAELLWLVACLFGVAAAAYALSRFDKAALKALGMTMATGGAIVCSFMALVALIRHVRLDIHTALTFGRSFLLYLPVAFVIEEVAFRGAIDSFVQRPNEGQGVVSALVVSSLWGLWHIPIVPHAGPGTALLLVIWQCILGLPLSFGWRISGNLGVPAIVHAFADAVRNALLYA